MYFILFIKVYSSLTKMYKKVTYPYTLNMKEKQEKGKKVIIMLTITVKLVIKHFHIGTKAIPYYICFASRLHKIVHNINSHQSPATRSYLVVLNNLRRRLFSRYVKQVTRIILYFPLIISLVHSSHYFVIVSYEVSAAILFFKY